MKEKPAVQSKPVSRLSHSLTFGNIWLAALSIIRARRAYAYALPDEINLKFGFRPSKLMTYFVLYKLEGEGLISARLEGRRKYYAISAKGRAALAQAKGMLSRLSGKL